MIFKTALSFELCVNMIRIRIHGKENSCSKKKFNQLFIEISRPEKETSTTWYIKIIMEKIQIEVTFTIYPRFELWVNMIASTVKQLPVIMDK